MKDEDFDSNARKLLFRRLLEGSPDKTLNYAPDHVGRDPGPLTIQITKILSRHSKLWADTMRRAGAMTAEQGKAAWLEEMREADAEIKRFLAWHTLGHGAAA